MASLNKQVTLVVSPFGPFYSDMLPLCVSGVASLADCKVWPFQKQGRL
jgi:hypothetical protein